MVDLSKYLEQAADAVKLMRAEQANRRYGGALTLAGNERPDGEIEGLGVLGGHRVEPGVGEAERRQAEARPLAVEQREEAADDRVRLGVPSFGVVCWWFDLFCVTSW